MSLEPGAWSLEHCPDVGVENASFVCEVDEIQEDQA